MGATGMKIPMPHILGADGAGVVVEVGSEAEKREDRRQSMSLFLHRLRRV